MSALPTSAPLYCDYRHTLAHTVYAVLKIVLTWLSMFQASCWKSIRLHTKGGISAVKHALCWGNAALLLLLLIRCGSLIDLGNSFSVENESDFEN